MAFTAASLLWVERPRVRMGLRDHASERLGKGGRAVPFLLFVAVVVLMVAGLLALMYVAARYWL